MTENHFSRKIFALLLREARGERSWRQFASDCDISYVQMRKLAQEEQENPPRPKLIRKLSDHAFGEVDFEDFMFAAGRAVPEAGFVVREEREKQDDITSFYRSLPQKDKNALLSYAEFLWNRQQSKQKKKNEKEQ